MSQRGSATVELALALPAVAVLLAMALGAIRWTVEAAIAQDAAATAARVAMVEGVESGADAGEAVANDRASVVVTQGDGWFVAVATLRSRGPWPQVRATARAIQP